MKLIFYIVKINRTAHAVRGELWFVVRERARGAHEESLRALEHHA